MQSASRHPFLASEQLKFVKDVCDRAPAGAMKDAARKHYAAAEDAYRRNDLNTCIDELFETRVALA